MDKYAIISISGRQYLVEEGQEIIVDKTDKPEAKILLVRSGKKVIVGKPEVKEAKIVLKVLKQEKGKKIDVLKYKAKSRYRKKIGFRPLQTRLKVDKITIS